MIHFSGNSMEKGCRPTFICHAQMEHPSNWTFHLHEHGNALEITYLFNGKAQIYCNGKECTVHSDSLVMVNPDVVHAISTSEGDPVERAVIQFRGVRIEDGGKTVTKPLVYQNDPANGDFNAAMAAIRELARFFLQLYRPLEKGQSDNIRIHPLWSDPAWPGGQGEDGTKKEIPEDLALRTSACFLSLIEYLMQTQKALNMEGTDDETMFRLMNYIEKNFSHKLTVGELAEKCYLSPYHMSRRFKKASGFTVNHFLNNCRLGKAEEMLLFTDEKIPYIARTSGFENYSYFYAVFRKINGCTPLEYRQHRAYTYFRRLL